MESWKDRLLYHAVKCVVPVDFVTYCTYPRRAHTAYSLSAGRTNFRRAKNSSTASWTNAG